MTKPLLLAFSTLIIGLVVGFLFGNQPSLETSSAPEQTVLKMVTPTHVTNSAPSATTSLRTPTETNQQPANSASETSTSNISIEPYTPNTDNLREYANYSRVVLEGMAQSGNPEAQLLYGLSFGEENLQQANLWLEEALIAGGYSRGLIELSKFHLEVAMELDEDLAELKAEATTNDATEDLEKQVYELRSRAYFWAQVAIYSGDKQASAWLAKQRTLEFGNSETLELNEAAKRHIGKIQLLRYRNGISIPDSHVDEYATDWLDQLRPSAFTEY